MTAHRLFVEAAATLHIEALYLRVQAEPCGRLRLLLHLGHDEEQACDLGKVLWFVQAEDDGTITLWHRNRKPPKGFHLHVCGPCAWYALIWFLRHVAKHDAALYGHGPQAPPCAYVGAGASQ